MRHVEVMLSSYKITLNNCKVYLFIEKVENVNYKKYCRNYRKCNLDVLKTLLTSAGDCLVHRLRNNWSDERDY